MNCLQQLRLSLGVSVEALAKAIGVSSESYWDLENDEHELYEAVSLSQLVLLARELAVAPSALFGGASTEVLTTDALARAVRETLDRSGESLSTFEDRIGWDVAAALANPSLFLEFNVDGLRAVCGAVGLDWHSLIDTVPE